MFYFFIGKLGQLAKTRNRFNKKNCFKIRLAITSKGKGKSGGARIITHVQVAANSVFLLSIYDKSERENLTDTKIEALVKNLS